MYQTPASPAAPFRRSGILIACMLAMFMSAVEVTIIATAMPDIIANLGGFPLLSWVFSIYLLLQAISIPIYGHLADIFGRKPVFFVGIGLFLTGSMLCGFSSHMLALIFFRALQGLGAGAIVPLSITIIADVYNQQERARLQGYLSSVWAVSAIIGPLMGAFIVEHYHWSGVFWVNVPFGIISAGLLARYLPVSPNQSDASSLDMAGITYMTLSVGCLLIALLQGNEIIGQCRVGLLVLSLISAVLLVQEQRRSTSPLFPLALWKSQIIIAGNVGGLIIGASMMSIAAFLPTYIQAVLGGTTLEAGWTLAVMSLGWPLASTLCGRFMIHTSYRLMAWCGAGLLVAGSLLLLRLNAESSMSLARLASFVIGLGMGVSNTTFLVSVQNEAPFAIRSIATASTVFTRMVGSALGTALLGATLNINLQRFLPGIDNPVQHLIAHHGQSSQELAYMAQQVAVSMHGVYCVSSLIALCALGAAVLVPRGLRPRQDE
ncbi:MFS transporter [secondary endosymbiont of Ctenarytaina eucalypti]|uniref:Arabinose efflux permease family protein n=1 Tax=secondary endosymbiont of Ctenarytaina eucalypti TaxID=1199245 RepID=J3TXN6_9ENTR|nr:MFS transporter [secondary endosymbiont of Ctenarytaina eucalypti]AFP84990.1 arabinose efflux permease family protein [secondary endosymbiont of Ctenarytaina eucalypti]